MKQARILIVAGSDSGGGAGVQADIKTVTALGGFATTAIAAITVQNTLGVTGVHPIPPEIVAAQIEAVMSDIGADAWKLGMLGSTDIVETVAESYSRLGAGIPLVLDPVMIAKGGASLLAEDAIDAVKSRLLPLAAIATPNAPEAERLTGLPVRDLDGQKRAAEALLEAGARAVLVKGGHIGDGAIVRDVLATQGNLEVFEAERIDTRATHGTGCTLASAIAAGLGEGLPLREAIVRARTYLRRAMLNAPGFGRGAQPLGHAWPFNASTVRDAP
ncbi:MAG: bifunctional hydroxymethylpyrimidine kinase/phosphomethylpyrimidine kinase [Hyphomonadaceae bacterium]|nr:bifunctional hydroxymethylpyrimidine kinase/phosphomethylpyrimidine kinase [Hyphomonadaceae bacterium]